MPLPANWKLERHRMINMGGFSQKQAGCFMWKEKAVRGKKKKTHTIHSQHYSHWRLQLEPTTGEWEAFQGKGENATHSNSILHLLGCGTRCGWRWLWGATLSGTVWKSKPVTDRLPGQSLHATPLLCVNTACQPTLLSYGPRSVTKPGSPWNCEHQSDVMKILRANKKATEGERKPRPPVNCQSLTNFIFTAQ